MTLPVHLSVDQLHLDVLISLIPYPIHGFSSEVFLPLYIFLESVPTKQEDHCFFFFNLQFAKDFRLLGGVMVVVLQRHFGFIH